MSENKISLIYNVHIKDNNTTKGEIKINKNSHFIDIIKILNKVLQFFNLGTQKCCWKLHLP